jgi:predicted transcriptional regulator
MSSVAVKLSEALDCRLTALARRRRTSRAAVMREALAALIAREEPPLTAGEVAADLIGSLEGPEAKHGSA